MSRFRHDMPFGAELQADGATRFRLWAPAQEKIAVVIDGGRSLDLAPAGEGWFALTTDAARAGSRYAFRLGDGLLVPDPASRQQAEDVHGPSVVVDPEAYSWQVTDWRGRPWREAVLYELHTGTFTPQGDFAAIIDKLDWLVDLGVTAVELMPVAEFKGARGWGYDGVLPFAPEAAYGSPYALKSLVDAAHARGLMIFLDVVYNHFGPDGNYLSLYAPGFFTERHHTPWGAAIDFANPVVRSFFIHNALYWLNEFRFDGLRLDAVHAIKDDSATHVLAELSATVRRLCGPDRHVHLVLENDANQARFLHRLPEQGYDAQWNDDFHHVAHVVLTGEADSYYGDYAEAPARALGRALAEGFIYQGEPSPHRDGEARGEPSGDLPATAFVNFLQNHDQIGNRAIGERLTTLVPPQKLEALLAVTLLAPQVPMLFMGEEWGAAEPFLFFCDFDGDLAQAVRDGRRREFAKFAAFADEAMRARIPDPNDAATFARSKLDWSRLLEPPHVARAGLVKSLLEIRRREIVPLLERGLTESRYDARGGVLQVEWRLADGKRLTLAANLQDTPAGYPIGEGRVIHATHADLHHGELPPWSVIWQRHDPGAQ